MNLFNAILFFSVAAAVCAPGAFAQPAKPAAKKAPPPKRAALFIGAGKSGILPKVDILPTAEQIEAEAQKLSSRLRNSDPFGLATFPREDAQPIMEDDSLRVMQKVTLNQALQTLRINGVNLKRKEFLIGGRNAMEGDVIELSFRGEVFQAEILEISATEVLFRDQQRNETGVLRHKIVPHFNGEPIRNVASRAESRMTPMEPATPPRQ